MFLCDGAGRYGNERCTVAKELIKRGASLEVYDQHGNTPFLIASSAGFIAMLEVLVAAGAWTEVRGLRCTKTYFP